jgi:hypothetical protein
MRLYTPFSFFLESKKKKKKKKKTDDQEAILDPVEGISFGVNRQRKALGSEFTAFF